jgi:hypothetical protein
MAEPSAQAAPVRIRHYCHGIGDCHLLRFPRAEGADFTILIDCGIHPSVAGGAATMRRIVQDIASLTDRIDVLVVTHEHMDHVSGFLSAAAEFAHLTIADVWFGWTENPADPQAMALDKYTGESLAALNLASSRLAANGAAEQPGLDALLGFWFGAAGERVRAARDAARKLATGSVSYHEPGAGPLPLPGVPGVRVYVLGPPRGLKELRRATDPDETFPAGLAPQAAMARALAMGSGQTPAAQDHDAPFDPEVGISLNDVLPQAAAGTDPGDLPPDRRAVVDLLRTAYVGPVIRADGIADQAWRRIDSDYLGLAPELALQLDQLTNNCSLVLAFEFTDTGRVLLFTGDAQVGSWLSWQNVAFPNVTGPDLLARTVYLKVAHHGSHNATLRQKGLELMTSPDLVAFIPVNAAQAKRLGWGRMPWQGILDALETRTRGRTIRADAPWIATGRIPTALRRGGSARVSGTDPDGLWIELELS